VLAPLSSKTGGETWSVVGGVASMLELSRAAAPAADSGFSTDVDRRLEGLQYHRLHQLKIALDKCMHFISLKKLKTVKV